MAENKKPKPTPSTLTTPKVGFALEKGLALLVALTLIAVLAERPLLETSMGWILRMAFWPFIAVATVLAVISVTA